MVSVETLDMPLKQLRKRGVAASQHPYGGLQWCAPEVQIPGCFVSHASSGSPQNKLFLVY